MLKKLLLPTLGSSMAAAEWAAVPVGSSLYCCPLEFLTYVIW